MQKNGDGGRQQAVVGVAQEDNQADDGKAARPDGLAALSWSLRGRCRRRSQAPELYHGSRLSPLGGCLLASVQSIHVPGMDHNAPIPAGAKVGNIVMSSPISGRELGTNRLPEDPDERIILRRRHIKAWHKGK